MRCTINLTHVTEFSTHAELYQHYREAHPYLEGQRRTGEAAEEDVSITITPQRFAHLSIEEVVEMKEFYLPEHLHRHICTASDTSLHSYRCEDPLCVLPGVGGVCLACNMVLDLTVGNEE
jgi:hypothetical protein